MSAFIAFETSMHPSFVNPRALKPHLKPKKKKERKSGRGKETKREKENENKETWKEKEGKKENGEPMGWLKLKTSEVPLSSNWRSLVQSLADACAVGSW
jgi:hypothetical protein